MLSFVTIQWHQETTNTTPTWNYINSAEPFHVEGPHVGKWRPFRDILENGKCYSLYGPTFGGYSTWSYSLYGPTFGGYSTWKNFGITDIPICYETIEKARIIHAICRDAYKSDEELMEMIDIMRSVKGEPDAFAVLKKKLLIWKAGPKLQTMVKANKLLTF